MLKLIYLARRNPGFTFDQFVCRWRMHGARAMEAPMWRHAIGYVQAEPLQPTPVAGASGDYDAVACYMVRDDMFVDMNDEDMAGAMKMLEDELETFSGPIADVSLWVREEKIKPGELGGITAFLFFSDAAKARETGERFRDATALHRITLNLRDDSALGAEANTLPYEAVLELATWSPADLARVLESDGASLPSTPEVMTINREAVFWDRLS